MKDNKKLPARTSKAKVETIRRDLFTVESIREKITTDPRWTYRAILALYERQTEEEKHGKHTDQINAAGFNKYDAEYLSSLAEYLQEHGYLSLGQLSAAQKKIGKYAKQLYRIAIAKEKAKDVSDVD